MSLAGARAAVTNILDRAAFTDGPFWEAGEYERDHLEGVLGPLHLEGTSALFLALGVLNEIAIELLTDERPDISRHEVIGRIRHRALELLALPDDE